MPDQDAFLLIGRIYINACQNAVFAVHGCFHQITNASFAAVIDTTACLDLFGWWYGTSVQFCWRLFEARLIGNSSSKESMALHTLFNYRWTLSVINTNYSFVFISLSAFYLLVTRAGNRTRVAGVRGRSLNRLTNESALVTCHTLYFDLRLCRVLCF